MLVNQARPAYGNARGSPKLPQSLDELTEDAVLHIPATYKDYVNLLDETPYPIRFLDDEIIIMGQASITHEQLVIRLGKLLAIFFDELDDYRVIGSNVKIMIPEQRGDVSRCRNDECIHALAR